MPGKRFEGLTRTPVDLLGLNVPKHRQCDDIWTMHASAHKMPLSRNAEN